MTEVSSAMQPSRPSVVVVGGGIGGLYAAYQMGRAGYPVTLLEQGDRWGGRIESVKMDSGGNEPFIAEYGPMRFEPELQRMLVKLAGHLGLEFADFAPTTAPACPTEYELSDIEASFESAAELLMWAVLRMFFREPTAAEKAAVDTTKIRRLWDGTPAPGPIELTVLREMADEVLVPDYETAQANLDRLRLEGRLCGSEEAGAPLLRDLGLWNALAEVLSPGALAKIRDSGTFYHFLPHNPSAVEWGIFWLRQASNRGTRIMTFDRETAPEGVATLAAKLRAKILATCPTVRMYGKQKVLSIEDGTSPGEVQLRVRSGNELDTYELRAQHVILALPQASLTELAGPFPEEIRRDIDSVIALPMLKAFLVTKTPWWKHHFDAQSHAWLIPTRELHYFTSPNADPACPARHEPFAACGCGDVESGMVMLYTDVPAIDFWKPFIKQQEQFSALLYPRDGEDERLKRALVRQLLVEADPDVSTKIDMERYRVIDELRDADDPPRELLAKIMAMPLSRKLSQVMREHLKDCTGAEEKTIEIVLSKAFGRDRTWLEELRREPEPNPPTKEQLVDRYMGDVLAYGIHDWSRKPFGGAAHVWKPGTDSIAASRRMHAFGLHGRPDLPNLHICGEAYSDFQGFIEGALRSAEQVCARIDPALSFELEPAVRAG